MDDFDVMRLDVQLSILRPSLIQAKYDIAEAKRELALIIGIPLQLEYGLMGDLNQFNIYSEQAVSPENSGIKQVDRMTQLPSQLMGDDLDLSQQRGDLRLLQASLNLKDKEIKAEKARFLPVITANYNLQWAAAEPDLPTFLRIVHVFRPLVCV